MKIPEGKCNQAASTAAVIFEIIYWGVAAVYVLMLMTLVYDPTYLSSLKDAPNHWVAFFAVFDYNVEGLSNVRGLFALAILQSISLISLGAMILHKIHLIFEITAGKTRDSIGPTPFQPANVKLLRQIGILAVACPILNFLISLLVVLLYGTDVAIPILSPEGLFAGVVILCLSRFFAHGVALQIDVDGLL